MNKNILVVAICYVNHKKDKNIYETRTFIKIHIKIEYKRILSFGPVNFII
jgi:hypothetical protein